MADTDDDYVYDDASGEWIPAAEAAAKKAAAEIASAGVVEVRDSVGNLLADGDSVILTRISRSRAPARRCSGARSSSRSA